MFYLCVCAARCQSQAGADEGDKNKFPHMFRFG
jgi:hypothetical protein